MLQNIITLILTIVVQNTDTLMKPLTYTYLIHSKCSWVKHE